MTLRVGGLACLLLAGTGCPPADRATQPLSFPASAEPPALERTFELLGRRALVRTSTGTVVALFDAKMPPKVAFVPPAARANEWTLELDGRPIGIVQTGPLSVLTSSVTTTSTVPVRAHLRLRHRRATGSKTVAEWEVLLARAPEHMRPVAEISALRQAGRYDQAQALLKQRISGLEPWVRLWMVVEDARITDRSGDILEAIRRWETSETIAEDLNVVSEVARRRMAAFFHSLWVEDYERAKSNLGIATKVLEGIEDAHLEGHLLYCQSLLAHKLGDYFAAANLTKAAADRLFDADEALVASHFRRQLAVVLSELGRHNAAWSLMVELFREISDAGPQELKAQFLTDFSWIEIQAMQAGDISFKMARPRKRLQRAVTIWRDLAQPAREAPALANLALVEFLDGQAKTALDLVARVRQTNPNEQSSETRFLNLLEADIHLSQDAPDLARAIFARVLEVRAAATDWTWRAYYGLARAALAEGQPDKAVEHFEAALRDRRSVGARAAIRSDEATYLADRAEVIREATEVHLKLRNVERAFQIDETGRAEVLRSLDTDVRRARLSRADRDTFDSMVIGYLDLKKAAQTKPAAALQARRYFDEIFEWLDQRVPPEPGAIAAADVQALLKADEAVVTFSRQPFGFLSFWVDRDKIEYRRGSGEPATIWRDRIRAKRRIYAVPGDVPAARDLHAHPFENGRPLIDTVEVSYLPHAGFLSPRGEAPLGPPLVVAVPGVDGVLTYVKQEAKVVGDLLASATVLADDEANRDTVLGAARGRRLLHFAGHGVIRLSDPWDAHITLARGERLTLEDLLISRPRVGAAVLNGCETGKGASLSRREAVGLAEGFLVIGARWVLASAERIRDDRALSFVQAFYRAGGAQRPTLAFRAVAKAQIKAGETEWKTYRLYGRP